MGRVAHLAWGAATGDDLLNHLDNVVLGYRDDRPAAPGRDKVAPDRVLGIPLGSQARYMPGDERFGDALEGVLALARLFAPALLLPLPRVYPAFEELFHLTGQLSRLAQREVIGVPAQR